MVSKKSSRKITTSLIILTRNEIDGMRAMLKKIPLSKVDEAFLVDYQSDDGTIELAQKNNLKVINQKKPGRGEAFRLASQTAKGKYLIFFSPDGNENPRDIEKIANLLKQDYDLVIASRFMPGSRNEEDGQLLKFRAWANQGFTFLANLLFGGNLTDSINGYRGIKKQVFNQLHLDGDGFVIEYQMSIRALKLKLKIIEFPTIEGNRIGGQSGSKAIPTGLQFIYYLIREIFIGRKF